MRTLFGKLLLNLRAYITRRSGLFDRDYYLQVYPDIADGKRDPLLHYCEYGHRERRRPSANVHPDFIAVSQIGRHFPGMNPIVCWALIGRWLGWRLGWPQLNGRQLGFPTRRQQMVIVLHELSRTGAPLFAIRLARWLRDHGTSPLIVALDGGPLLPELCDDFPFLPLFALRPADRRTHLRRWIAEDALLYINSAASSPIWQFLDGHQGPVALHIHESRSMAERYAPDLQRWSAAQPRLIAVNDSIGDFIVEIFASRALIVPPAIDVAHCNRIAAATQRVPTIIGCGVRSRRKGADLFCHVAAALVERYAGPVQFVWVGDDGDVDMNRLIHELHLEEKVSLAGPVTDPLPLIAGAAALLLPSRDDPYPTVAIESAACATPIICFDTMESGVGEWIASGAGRMVPAFDVSAMASALETFLRFPSKAADAGAYAAKIAHQFDIECVAPRILAHISATGLQA